MNLVADAYARDIDAILGFYPLPFLRMGAIGGIGSGDASYAFAANPGGSDSDSTGKRLGGFIGGVHLVGPVLLSADLSYVTIWNDQRYNPTNSPPKASWDSELLTLTLGADYQVMPDVTLWGKPASITSCLRLSRRPTRQTTPTGWPCSLVRPMHCLTRST